MVPTSMIGIIRLPTAIPNKCSPTFWAMTTTANPPCSDCFAMCHAVTRQFTLLIAGRRDGLIVQALESLQLLESLAAQGTRFTFFLFPSEDTESMNNLLELFYFAGDRVDYVIVHNPAKVRTNLFRKSNIEAELKKFGAKELTLPVVTSITLLAIKRAEAKAGRKLSFAEVATPGASHLELMLAGEMQWAMQQMFRQYDAMADLLVPPQQVPDVQPQSGPAAKPSRPNHPMLNLGE
jgi:hypothetical protein